jgi:hypothetical protein
MRSVMRSAKARDCTSARTVIGGAVGQLPPPQLPTPGADWLLPPDLTKSKHEVEAWSLSCVPPRLPRSSRSGVARTLPGLQHNALWDITNLLAVCSQPYWEIIWLQFYEMGAPLRPHLISIVFATASPSDRCSLE